MREANSRKAIKANPSLCRLDRKSAMNFGGHTHNKFPTETTR